MFPCKQRRAENYLHLPHVQISLRKEHTNCPIQIRLHHTPPILLNGITLQPGAVVAYPTRTTPPPPPPPPPANPPPGATQSESAAVGSASSDQTIYSDESPLTVSSFSFGEFISSLTLPEDKPEGENGETNVAKETEEDTSLAKPQECNSIEDVTGTSNDDAKEKPNHVPTEEDNIPVDENTANAMDETKAENSNELEDENTCIANVLQAAISKTSTLSGYKQGKTLKSEGKQQSNTNSKKQKSKTSKKTQDEEAAKAADKKEEESDDKSVANVTNNEDDNTRESQPETKEEPKDSVEIKVNAGEVEILSKAKKDVKLKSDVNESLGKTVKSDRKANSSSSKRVPEESTQSQGVKRRQSTGPSTTSMHVSQKPQASKADNRQRKGSAGISRRSTPVLKKREASKAESTQRKRSPSIPRTSTPIPKKLDANKVDNSQIPSISRTISPIPKKGSFARSRTPVPKTLEVSKGSVTPRQESTGLSLKKPDAITPRKGSAKVRKATLKVKGSQPEPIPFDDSQFWTDIEDADDFQTFAPDASDEKEKEEGKKSTLPRFKYLRRKETMRESFAASGRYSSIKGSFRPLDTSLLQNRRFYKWRRDYVSGLSMYSKDQLSGFEESIAALPAQDDMRKRLRVNSGAKRYKGSKRTKTNPVQWICHIFHRKPVGMQNLKSTWSEPESHDRSGKVIPRCLISIRKVPSLGTKAAKELLGQKVRRLSRRLGMPRNCVKVYGAGDIKFVKCSGKLIIVGEGTTSILILGFLRAEEKFVVVRMFKQPFGGGKTKEIMDQAFLLAHLNKADVTADFHGLVPLDPMESSAIGTHRVAMVSRFVGRTPACTVSTVATLCETASRSRDPDDEQRPGNQLKAMHLVLNIIRAVKRVHASSLLTLGLQPDKVRNLV